MPDRTTNAISGGSSEFRRILRLGLPLGVSIAIHVALLIGTGFVVWRVSHADPVREVFVSFDDPSLAGSTVEASAPARTPIATPTTSAPTMSDLGPAERPDLSSVSVAPRAASDADTLDVIGDLFDRPAGGSAGGLDGDPFDGSAIALPDVEFIGLGTSNARSIVYVIDASGPMVTSLGLVREELLRSIDRLGPTQRFGVVAFRSEPDGTNASNVFAPVLVRATGRAKQRLADWLDTVTPRGRSAPLHGLRRAIRLRPDAIFLLSRSIERSGGGVWDEGLETTLAELDRLNPIVDGALRRITIKTIQFRSEDPSGIMQAIGRLHGGGESGAGYTVIGTEEIEGG